MPFETHSRTLIQNVLKWHPTKRSTFVNVWLASTSHCLSYERKMPFMTTSSNGNISALLALCAGDSLVTGGFPPPRQVTPSFDVFFDRCLDKRLSKQWWGWWFETPSRSLWRHCNGLIWYEPRQWLLVDMPHICHAHMWEILLKPQYPFRKNKYKHETRWQNNT